jgi:hypothetical protein
MTTLKLTGLDVQNPLAYFAALGLLRVLDDHACRHKSARPRLAFVDEGAYLPILEADASLDEVIRIVLEDAAAEADNPVLQLAYDDEGRRAAPGQAGATRDLKPSPSLARQMLLDAVSKPRRVADLAAGFFSELVQDNNGKTKPTAFHFTAGQQCFLEMVEALRAGVTTEDVHEALMGPWTNKSQLPSLSWDASVGRSYALRASNPSKEKRGSIPAANWLGIQALGFFPVAVKANRLTTTCVKGGWKTGVFCWPVWRAPIQVTSVASLLRVPAERWTAVEREAMGILTVLSAKILRSDQGGGSFSPAEVVLPRGSG